MCDKKSCDKCQDKEDKWFYIWLSVLVIVLAIPNIIDLARVLFG